MKARKAYKQGRVAAELEVARKAGKSTERAKLVDPDYQRRRKEAGLVPVPPPEVTFDEDIEKARRLAAGGVPEPGQGGWSDIARMAKAGASPEMRRLVGGMTPEQRQQYETYKAVGKKEHLPAGEEDIQKF